MAQHDYIIANQSGAAFRADLNNALAAIVSQNSGAAEPSVTYAYMPWADTTTGLLKIRNAANSAWITLYQLDGEWSTIALENGTAAAPSLYFKDSGTDTGVYSPGVDQVAIATAGVQRVNFSTTEVVFNEGGGDVDFRIEGDTEPDLFKVDAGANTVTIATLSDSAGANTSTPAQIASGRAKAWVNFNGTGTVAIRASYNVSSITDNGTGDYTVNFTTALADANYVISGGCGSPGTASGVFLPSALGAPTASGAHIYTTSTAFTSYDHTYNYVAIFR